MPNALDDKRLAALIRRGRLDEQCLAGEVVVVTGAGGGIGFEAARSLLELGASVVVAELDATLCPAAVATLAGEFSPDRVMACVVDVSDATAVDQMFKAATARFGKIDAVLNNAAYAPAGASVVEFGIDSWDRSFAVNLRGPVLLARACLPAMIDRRHGVFACVSSAGGPFLAPYETLKAAQVALASSLDAELTGTGVTAFTIGPGLVPTATAVAAVEMIAPRLGTTVQDFWQANKSVVLSVEAAGAGFAAAVAMAERYAGQEISSTQALIDAGITIPDSGESDSPRIAAGMHDAAAAATACGDVVRTLEDQAAGWRERSFFERQWMLRDFKQRVGVPVERCIETLEALETGLRSGRGPEVNGEVATLQRLAAFYRHLRELAAGYVKDPGQREEQMAIADGWADEVNRLITALGQS